VDVLEIALVQSIDHIELTLMERFQSGHIALVEVVEPALVKAS